jgi:hypothetical protein
MGFDEDTIEWVYRRTDGHCHLCRKKLSLKNYGVVGARMSWHIDHSVAQARGGTDHRNNLYPACIHCNTSKQDKGSRTVRAAHGHTKAPLSKDKKKSIKTRNAWIGGAVGGAAGLLLGPLGAAAGAAIGAGIGHSIDPDE